MIKLYGRDKRDEAAEFLVSLLAGEEMLSLEVYKIAKEKGISKSTLGRAKSMVGLKTRLVYRAGKQAWYMSVPEEMKGRTFSKPRPSSEAYQLKPAKEQIISSDWVYVATNDNYAASEKINIPDCKPKLNHAQRMSVKVGGYEFEIDENFPTDKLASLLQGLAVTAE